MTIIILSPFFEFGKKEFCTNYWILWHEITITNSLFKMHCLHYRLYLKCSTHLKRRALKKGIPCTVLIYKSVKEKIINRHLIGSHIFFFNLWYTKKLSGIFYTKILQNLEFPNTKFHFDIPFNFVDNVTFMNV